jgi:hypothetical protein
MHPGQPAQTLRHENISEMPFTDSWAKFVGTSGSESLRPPMEGGLWRRQGEQFIDKVLAKITG